MLAKGPCKIYFCTGPEQNGTGQAHFLGSMGTGHKHIFQIFEAGQTLSQ